MAKYTNTKIKITKVFLEAENFLNEVERLEKKNLFYRTEIRSSVDKKISLIDNELVTDWVKHEGRFNDAYFRYFEYNLNNIPEKYIPDLRLIPVVKSSEGYKDQGWSDIGFYIHTYYKKVSDESYIVKGVLKTTLGDGETEEVVPYYVSLDLYISIGDIAYVIQQSKK